MQTCKKVGDQYKIERFNMKFNPKVYLTSVPSICYGRHLHHV